MSALCNAFVAMAWLAAMGSTLVPREANAGSTFQNAVGACNGALPSYEGALRKRPLAIANEGAGAAFVSCTMPGDTLNDNTQVGVGVINRGTAPVVVSCTLVDGTAPEILGAIPPTFYPKAIAVLPGAGPSIVWQASEFGLTTFSFVSSLSCNLPPKVEIAGFITTSP